MQTVKLLRREKVAEGTMSFYFDKPAGFQFKPGQFVDCTLIDPPEIDAEGNIRSLSLASAPTEKDLMVATRMRDTAFKRVLKTMPVGSQLQIDGPLGSFTLHSAASRPADRGDRQAGVRVFELPAGDPVAAGAGALSDNLFRAPF